jgi:hypothetical protein
LKTQRGFGSFPYLTPLPYNFPLEQNPNFQDPLGIFGFVFDMDPNFSDDTQEEGKFQNEHNGREA